MPDIGCEAHSDGRGDTCDDIIEHHTQGIASLIGPADWAGFQNIKEAKPKEGHEPTWPERNGVNASVRCADQDW